MPVPAHSYLGTGSTTSPEALSCLRRDIVSGESSCDPANRASIWRALLVNDQEYTPDLTQARRSRAADLRAQYSLRKPDAELDPLTESPDWTQYYKDEELRSVIALDCARIFPDEPWYQEMPQQTVLLEVLLIWCKINVAIGYRQGIHELAGIIVWVVFQDDASAGKEFEDAYTIFSAIMMNAKAFYAREADGSASITAHANHIQNDLLAVLDQGLCSHLKALGIEAQLYCTKWLRLIFSREFQFDDVLLMWDVLLAADASLYLMDYVCCAMLLRKRSAIMASDYNTSLTLLMRYPAQKTNAASFVQDALHLRNYFTPNGGQAIIDRYSDGKIVNDKPLELGLHKGYSLGALLSQTEKLGINSYVRGAVEEVRRNVTPMLSDPRQALRNGSREGSYTTPATDTFHRDRELASLLSAAIQGLRHGDTQASTITRLEDIRSVLQGQKTVAQLNAKQSVPDKASLRPSSAPHHATPVVIRARSPIRIPAIKSRAPSSRPTTASSLGEDDQDIPLSVSPTKSGSKQVKKADFAYLFGPDTTSTFNRSRHT